MVSDSTGSSCKGSVLCSSVADVLCVFGIYVSYRISRTDEPVVVCGGVVVVVVAGDAVVVCVGVVVAAVAGGTVVVFGGVVVTGVVDGMVVMFSVVVLG